VVAAGVEAVAFVDAAAVFLAFFLAVVVLDGAVVAGAAVVASD
jgi:hypothetical protein